MKKKYHRLNLFLELYKNSQLPNCYLDVIHKNEKLLIDNIQKSNPESFFCYSHNLSPNYLKYSINDNLYRLIKIKQSNKGYAIDLSKSSSLDSFMRDTMSKRFRKTVRQTIKRLESAYTITYKMYLDDISKEDYDTLLDNLEYMLKVRFEQKNIKNENLGKWPQIKQDFYTSLKNKKASIFVIYNNNTPIDISLNYLSNGIIFSWISSYDIKYFKSSLGVIDLYKHVEWCFNTNYEIIELGYGDHSYKKKWSNLIYNFEHHIVYKRHSTKSKLLAFCEFIKIKIKEFIKHSGLLKYLKNVKR
jgi:CelD/BcsL family acetyltransferase involved in cellulose biosynthesis